MIIIIIFAMKVVDLLNIQNAFDYYYSYSYTLSTPMQVIGLLYDLYNKFEAILSTTPNSVMFLSSIDFELYKSLKWRSTTRDFIFMFWIIANDCACLMIYIFRECLVNKLNYGISY